MFLDPEPQAGPAGPPPPNMDVTYATPEEGALRPPIIPTVDV
jgi:hypothetical protein